MSLYARTDSPQVQPAIAGILLSADRGNLSGQRLLQVVQANRRFDARDSVIDTLIAALRRRQLLFACATQANDVGIVAG